MPARMLVGENDLVITGGTSAVREAVADPVGPVLVPDSVDEMKPLMLSCGPDVVAVTFTCTVQPVLAAMVAPVGLPKVSVVAPAMGAHVGVPAQVVLAAGVAATWTPLGKL